MAADATWEGLVHEVEYYAAAGIVLALAYIAIALYLGWWPFEKQRE